MRTLIASLLLTSALPTFADTYQLDTNVTRALITGSGGVVTYTTDLELAPGRHTLIAYLPKNGWGTSVLDTRIGDPNTVRIISQAAGSEHAKPITRDPSAAESAAETALEAALKNQRDFEQTYESTRADLDAAETQLQLLRVTAKTGFGTPDAGLNAEQLLAVTQVLGEATKTATLAVAEAKTALLAMEPQRRDLQKAVREAQETLDALRPQSHIELIQVTTEIEVSAAQTAEIEFDNLEDAGWRPQYVAELTQDGTKGTLDLHRKAVVYVGEQGEKPLDEWENVDITLSTANLDDRTNTNIPRPDLRTLIDEAVLRKNKRVATSYDTASPRMEASEVEEPIVAALSVIDEPSVTFAGQTLLFDIGTNAVDWTTETTSFNIDTLTFDLDLYAMANAARDDTGYLYTDLINTTGGVLLAGDITLHRDGTLVGSTYLPEMVPGQDESIGLGPLYGIQIQRDTLSVEEGDSGFISAKSEINQSYRTTLVSSLSYDIPMKLLDVIPTSENEDLVIRMDASPRPSDENRDGKRGVLVWDIDLGAGDTETVTFGYQMKWPNGQIPINK